MTRNPLYATLATVAVVASTALPSQAQNYSQYACPNFLGKDTVASSFYALAWPTATYVTIECADSIYQDRVTYYPFRLHGTGSLTGGHLWTEIIAGFDQQGELVYLDWGNHNNPFWPPGRTVGGTMELIRIFNEQQ